MEVLSVLDLAEELIWPFLAAVLAFLVAAFTHVLLLFRRPVPPSALLAAPLLVVFSTWVTSRIFVDASVLESIDAVESAVLGFGTTYVVGSIFALPTFAVCAIGLAVAGPRNRPWDTRTAIGLAALGLAMAGLVAFGAASNTGNPLFAGVRGVSYLLLTVLVVVAALESPNPEEPAPVGAGASASVLPVLWLGIAESAAWGFSHVLMPNQPPTLDPASCAELWPDAVAWMMTWMEAELPWSRAAFACAAAMAVVGAVRQYRARKDVAFVALTVVAIGMAALLWGSARLDDSYLLALGELCPRG
ncbi:MAG: hypothetical protein AAF602_05420 [Myxococcota bacterium]